MSAQIDFLALYRELGIDPTCSPEAFKHAYRRRVSELHPDRGSEGHAGEEALKVLNLGYAAALEFFQAHGRFPGAPPAPAAAPDADDTAAGAVPALWIGMSAREALDALGTPTDTTEDGRLWHYGPSWIRLSCREVVDWYSSPLKPLGHSPMHPDGDPDPLDAERGIACLELDPAAHR